MKNLKLSASALITGMIIFLVACDNFKNMPGSGACDYINLVEEYRIGKVTVINDTNYRIQFINTSWPELSRELNLNQVKADIPEFNDNLMQDKSQIYIIDIDVIRKGSCNQEIIRDIKLKA